MHIFVFWKLHEGIPSYAEGNLTERQWIGLTLDRLTWFYVCDYLCVMCSRDSANAVPPLRKKYALESSTFVVIAEVNLTEVQWKGLTLDRLVW